MGEYDLEKMEQGKRLGHTFNKENNNEAHIEKKEEEVTNTIAAIGLTLNNSKMGRVYIQSILIILKKMLHPITYIWPHRIPHKRKRI